MYQPSPALLSPLLAVGLLYILLYLECAASGHGFICIQSGAQLFAEELADSLFDGGDSGGPTHNLYSIDIFFLQLWIKGRGDEDDSKESALVLEPRVLDLGYFLFQIKIVLNWEHYLTRFKIETLIHQICVFLKSVYYDYSEWSPRPVRDR